MWSRVRSMLACVHACSVASPTAPVLDALLTNLWAAAGALPSTSFDLGPQQLLARRDSHAAASTSTAVATVVELPHGTPAWYHLVAGFGAMALTPDSWALQDFDPEQTKAGNKRGLSMANLAVVGADSRAGARSGGGGG